MGYQESNMSVSMEAGADLSSSQFHAVKLSSGKAVLAALGNRAVGVQVGKAALGEATEVCIFGKTKMKAGAAILVDAEVSIDANGKAKTAITGEHIVGRALEAASGDLSIIGVLLQYEGIKP